MERSCRRQDLHDQSGVNQCIDPADVLKFQLPARDGYVRIAVGQQRRGPDRNITGEAQAGAALKILSQPEIDIATDATVGLGATAHAYNIAVPVFIPCISSVLEGEILIQRIEMSRGIMRISSHCSSSCSRILLLKYIMRIERTGVLFKKGGCVLISLSSLSN